MVFQMLIKMLPASSGEQDTLLNFNAMQVYLNSLDDPDLREFESEILSEIDLRHQQMPPTLLHEENINSHLKRSKAPHILHEDIYYYLKVLGLQDLEEFYNILQTEMASRHLELVSRRNY